MRRMVGLDMVAEGIDMEILLVMWIILILMVGCGNVSVFFSRPQANLFVLLKVEFLSFCGLRT